MSLYFPAVAPAERDKLGLALAGGGFRASLFHVGVLRRMAELDLLRYVEVLSTVSGGSIVGALYILMLKERLDAKTNLTRDEYVDLVRNLEKVFVSGIQKDLRTRLLMNPLGMLSVLLSHDGLSRRMGRIYQRYLYRGTVDALRAQDQNLPKGNAIGRWLWPGWIPLRGMRFRPGGEEIIVGIDSYNDEALKRQGIPGSAIPNFIMNSTTLNSGAPFRFSSVEIGDPRLGYFRYDEIDLLKSRKNLIERPISELLAMLNGNVRPQLNNEPLPVALALWWLTRDTQQTKPPQDEWKHLFGNPATANVIDSMCKTNLGRLRQLKLPAWYVRKGSERHPVVTGGVSDPQQHLARFNRVLREVEPTVDPGITSAITNAITKKDPLGEELLDFAIELYYLRSAEVMSPRLRTDFDGISLGTAVAASANFPPLFPPLVLLGIYDDLHVTRLGLSDGGVYDNIGITTLLDEGCTHIIASDTGAPFETKQRVTSRYFGLITRLPAVLTDDVAEQQRTGLRERRRVSAGLANYNDQSQTLLDLKNAYGLKGLAFFSIDSFAATGGGGIHLGRSHREAVACLRTDLDSFGDLEVAALVNAGYDRADRFLHTYFTAPPYSAANNPAWNSLPKAPHAISADDAARTPRVLEVGRRRLLRALWLGSWQAWFFTLAATTVLLYLFGNREVSVPALLNRITGAMIQGLEVPLPFFPWINKRASALVTTPWPLWQLLLLAALAILFVFEVWPRLVRQLGLARAVKSRKLVWAMKWVRAIAPALLLFVRLTPVWIALAVFVVAEVSYWAYNKPFLWATRVR